MLGGLLAALTLAAMQPAPPAAEIRSEPAINIGTGLLENCTYADESNPAEAEFHLGLCIGFIKGVTNARAEQSPGQICPPEELDNEQLRDVVVRWLRANPMSLGRSAVGSVVSATTEAFPCNVEPASGEKVAEDGRISLS